MTAEKLETPEYRERVAESLYKGIAGYAQGINGAKAEGVDGGAGGAVEKQLLA